MKERKNKWIWLMFVAWMVSPFIACPIANHFRGGLLLYGVTAFGLITLISFIFWILDFNANKEWYQQDVEH